MLRFSFLAILATLAACALAVPTPFKAWNRLPQTFRFTTKPRLSASRTPFQELVRTYAKYGWQIIIAEPYNPYSNGYGTTSSSSALAPSHVQTESGDASIITVTTLVSVVAPTTAASTSAPFTSAVTTSAPTSWTTSVVAHNFTSLSASTIQSATSTASGETGEVSAIPEENESEYLSPVTIGGQSLNLDFDTGSADLWVFSSSLPSSLSAGHATFNPNKSSTWQAYDGATWQISYGDGSSARGTVGYDVVDIGGATVDKQAVELATSVSGSFVRDTNNDGLVGLGFSNINTIQPQRQKTFFENIMPRLALPLFTADLEEDASGTYTFGEIDKSEYSGDIHYTDVDTSNGFWEFKSKTYTVGGTTKPCGICSTAIADTGTSLMLIDDDILEDYYSQVAGSVMDSTQGGYIYPCESELPDFGVAVGDYTAIIKGAGINYAPLGDGTCFGGLQSNQGQGVQIYGDVLFKNFFAVFDGGNSSFGVAAKAEDASTV
ncbi:hypothetical protein LTR15_000756 [Elasticomyces elasticus]|nr:hypothetical protein LTR15_000756 [Elasticomyces elasticus]